MLIALLLACHPNATSPPIFDPPPAVIAETDAAHAGPANRLAEAASPYLRMHGHDPVDWYPWGDEAFAAAKSRGVPVFLSIGYFACHWCHVMHRESFRDPDIAAYMNEHFVSIKVDREERPDVDALYMDALQLMNGRGGWPASLWLTAEAVPFYAGTYFPPTASRGRPGFLDVLTEIDSRWRSDRVAVEDIGRQVEVKLAVLSATTMGALPDAALADLTARSLFESWDPARRGWSRSGSQFPMSPRLQFLISWAAQAPPSPNRDGVLSVITGALEAMDEGGIHDHIGGGFHRYTVDADWQIPHFEKMLYDNAQLIDVYAQAAVLTGDPRWQQVVKEAVRWLSRELRDDSGAFYSSQSADSADGDEGSYYVWTPSEIRSTLTNPEDFLAIYPVSEEGNFEGHRTVLQRQPDTDPTTVDLARQQLRRLRAQRSPPPTDTKQVVAWNGLAIGALSRAGRLLGEKEYVTLATQAAEALLSGRTEDGALPRVLADTSSPPGVLADYAFAADGLLALYEATGEPRWLIAADALASEMSTRFRGREGGLVLSAAEDLLMAQSDVTDGSEPSAPGRAAAVLLKLAAYGAPSGDRELAEEALRVADRTMRRSPGSTPSMAAAAMLSGRETMELVISADNLSDPRATTMQAAVDARLRPGAVSARLTPRWTTALSSFETLAGKGPGDLGVRGFVCFDGVCRAPTDDPKAFTAMMNDGLPDTIAP
jgi:uncharacterized protein YyaL (SSP411 family)